MSEMRGEPTLDPLPAGDAPRVDPASVTMPRPVEIAPSRPAAGPSGSDQLARIEDKTARIEEKFARQEATAQRVLDKLELASSRMGEVALQSELAVLRGEIAVIARRTRSLPGLAAITTASIVTAFLTAVFVILLIRYLPGLTGR